MSGLSIEDFEAFKRTPEATAPPKAGAGDYIERQRAIIAADEAAGYYENSPEADWLNSQGSTGYTPLDDEDFDQAERLQERRELATEMQTAAPHSRRAEAMESTRALLAEQEWIESYEQGYSDGYNDGEETAKSRQAAAMAELREELGRVQLENIRLRKQLIR